VASRSEKVNDEVITGKREREGEEKKGQFAEFVGLGKKSWEKIHAPQLSLLPSLSSSPYSPSDTLTPLLQAQPDL